MPRLLLPSLVFALVLAVPAAADQWERTYEVSGRPAVVVRADDASLQVTTWTRKAVGLRVTTRGWSIGPQGVRVESGQSGNHVECDVREPRLSWHWLLGWGERSVRIEVSLPPESDLDASTGDGSILLAPLSGVIHARTADGSIRADGLRGEVNLSTGDGHVHAFGLDGALDARSGDGSLEVEGRFDRLAVGTSDGRVLVTALEGSRLASDWRLHSGDGSVTLRIPRTLHADLSLHTGDGEISVDVPIEVSGELGRHTVRGSLNGGGPLLELRCGDGPIRLETL